MANFQQVSLILWPLLTLGCLVVILTGLKKVLKRTTFYIATAVIAVWVVLVSVLSVQGFFANFSALPPRPVLAIFIPLPVVMVIAFSKKGSRLLQSVPPQWLVWMQSFRIMVELLLWLAFVAGKLPVQMSFEGRNFDVLTGLAALPAGYLVYKKIYARTTVIAFNVLGLLLLLNVLIIAALSMPTPLRHFMNEPSTALVAQFPFILLPAVLVPIAYTLHIFSLRQQALLR